MGGHLAPATPPSDSSVGQEASDLPKEALTEQSEAWWTEQEQDARINYVKQVSQNYFAIVEEFLQQANACVKRFNDVTQKHSSWRRRMTWLAGGLAIVNVVGAFAAANRDGGGKFVTFAAVGISLLAAIYAAVISIFSNLESLNNLPEQAHVSREARELFLDNVRDAEMLWHVHVSPFGDSPTACINAARLYRQLVGHDQNLRRQVKEMNETKQPPKAKP